MYACIEVKHNVCLYTYYSAWCMLDSAIHVHKQPDLFVDFRLSNSFLAMQWSDTLSEAINREDLPPSAASLGVLSTPQPSGIDPLGIDDREATIDREDVLIRADRKRARRKSRDFWVIWNQTNAWSGHGWVEAKRLRSCGTIHPWTNIRLQEKSCPSTPRGGWGILEWGISPLIIDELCVTSQTHIYIYILIYCK